MNSEVADRLAARLARAPTPLALLREQGARRGDHPALVFMRSPDDPEPQVMSYAALAQAATLAAGELMTLGVTPSDGVALFTPAAPAGVAALFGAIEVGVAFPVNLLLSAEGMDAQLRLARARVALVWGGTDAAVRLASVAPALSDLRAVLDISDGARAWTPRPSSFPPPDFAGRLDRPAALFHTGGTTGDPKLAELSARGIAAAALMGGAALRLSEDDSICVALPLFHVGGAISCVMSALACGATVILPGLLGGRDPALRTGIWRLLERTRATVLAMVPTSLAGIIDTPLDGADLQALRGICTGAAPLPLDTLHRLEAKLGIPVCQMYGMTELSGVCSAQPLDGLFRSSAVGFPAPMIEARLGDGAPRPGARGDILLRGPNSFLGYRTASGRRDEPSDGWVITGDMGEVDRDGQLQLLGRSKDVIIRGGHNIDPLMIEEAAQQHPAVRICAAAPMPDAYAGELPALYVALNPRMEVTADELVAFVAERISDPPARPKRVFLLDDLPLTPVGKIARFRLRQAAAVQALKDAVAGAHNLRLSCDDPTAKTIELSGGHELPSDLVRDLEASAAKLGLKLAHAPDGY